MSSKVFLSTVMAAMLMVPAMAMAEDQPAGDPAPAAQEESSEDSGDHHGKMMMHKGFEEADTNKDGALSLEEFLERHKLKFAEIDADKNGSLTQDEMKTYGEAHREKMKERREDRRERMEDRKEGTPAE